MAKCYRLPPYSWWVYKRPGLGSGVGGFLLLFNYPDKADVYSSVKCSVRRLTPMQLIAFKIPLPAKMGAHCQHTEALGTDTGAGVLRSVLQSVPVQKHSKFISPAGEKKSNMKPNLLRKIKVWQQGCCTHQHRRAALQQHCITVSTPRVRSSARDFLLLAIPFCRGQFYHN